MKKLLTAKLIPLQIIYEKDNEFIVNNIFNEKYLGKNLLELKEQSYKRLLEEIIDILGTNNEELLEEYFDRTLTSRRIKEEI